MAAAPAPSQRTTCWTIVLNGHLVLQQVQFVLECNRRGEDWANAIKTVYLIVQSDNGMDTAFRRVSNLPRMKTLAIGAYERSLPLEVLSKPGTKAMPHITTLYLAWAWAAPHLKNQTALFYDEVWGAVYGMKEHLTRVFPKLKTLMIETNLDYVPHVSVDKATMTLTANTDVSRSSWLFTLCLGRCPVQ